MKPTGKVARQKDKRKSYRPLFYQTSAETSFAGESTTRGKRIDGHAEVSRRRRAVLFIYVASGGTMC